MPDTRTADQIREHAAAVRERLIDRRVAGGGNLGDSATLLANHVRTLGASALSYALHYDGFATARTADDDAAALLAYEAVR